MRGMGKEAPRDGQERGAEKWEVVMAAMRLPEVVGKRCFWEGRGGGFVLRRRTGRVNRVDRERV